MSRSRGERPQASEPAAVVVRDADLTLAETEAGSSLGRRILTVAIKAIVLVYAVVVLYFIWSTKSLTFASLAQDPFFAGYSVAVVVYLLSRFLLALFYRPVPDRGYRPTVTIVVPAFNEQEGIAGTLVSCLTVEYPSELLQVIAVNDGSTDATWDRIMAVREEHPELLAVDLGSNYGKRTAMAEGVRRASGEIVVFVDSDSYLAPDAVRHIVQPFTDPRVGASVGHAEVANRWVNWLTKMQQVRYYSAFLVIKGTESLLSGTVTCASGCCAAYRRDVIVSELPDW